jgi:quercetin dioxygenase-like cupin family protein
MALHCKAEDIPNRQVVRSGEQGVGSMIVKRAYGRECSLMHAVRAPGYHTTPHAHAAEQLNHVLEGEIWFFVEDQAFHCKAGDFQRVPSNKIHWAWNRSAGDAIVVEAHSPALVAGPQSEGSIGLFGDGERAAAKDASQNNFVPFDWQSVERKIFGE